MSYLARSLGYLAGITYWVYLSIPRFDVERRRSRRYRKALGITKNIWIASGCLMLVLLEAFPTAGVPLTLALSLLTTFLCYTILDEIE